MVVEGENVLLVQSQARPWHLGRIKELSMSWPEKGIEGWGGKLSKGGAAKPGKAMAAQLKK